MSFLLCLVVICFIICYAYWKFKAINSYWTNKNVAQCDSWPFLGNFGPVLFQKTSIGGLVNGLYDKFPNARYFGMYQFFLPNLVIKDLDLIKRITVRDFDIFPEHRTTVSEEVDPLFARNILFMKGGEKWQRLRSMLSPVFTSSKLRSMYPFMVKCAKQFTDHYDQINDTRELEMKDTFSRYTNDVIASIAFGIECNSFANSNDTFYLMGKKAVNVSIISIIKVLLYNIIPFIMKLLKFRIFPKDTTDFFRNIVKDTIKFREENGVVRPDLLFLLNEARKGRIKYDETENTADSSFAVVEESDIGKKQKFKYSDISDDDLIAQAFVFFLAGFDTSSTALSFCAYELAINPDVQQKLREEIDQALLASNSDFVSYENLSGMKYLDTVMAESLRKWPPIMFTDRRAVKPFTLEAKLPKEETVHFPEGTVCTLPLYSIQRDPKYYQNPEKFDPERFSDENKHLITPSSYLPFGMGPKNCIASRFALLEAKIIIFALLSKFEIVPVSKTHIPMVISKRGQFLAAEGGMWLGLKKRTL